MSLTAELNAAARAEEEGALTKAFRQAGADDEGESQSGDAGSEGGIEPPPEAEQTRARRAPGAFAPAKADEQEGAAQQGL